MTDVYENIDKYLKIRQMQKEELKSKDILNILMKKYIIPNEKDIEEFFNQTLEFVPGSERIIGAYGKEILRIAKLNKILRQSNDNPVVSYKPLIVDINRYKNKKDISSNFFIERGKFKVVNSLKNMLLLERENDSREGIRLTLNANVEKYARKGDMLDLMITRKLFVMYWDIVKVYECIPCSMMNDII